MGQYYGDPKAIGQAMVTEWYRRADTTPASPEGHVSALLDAAVAAGALRLIDGKASDGYHTFDDLYRHRMLLTAALFNRLYQGVDHAEFGLHKSLLHHDGEIPFGGGWFIVMAQLPTGQISYHYPLEHWDLFDIPSQPAADAWDGHNADEAANRLQWFLEGAQP